MEAGKDQTTAARSASMSHKDRAEECLACGQPITGGGVVFTPEQPPRYPRYYHPKCFSCKRCDSVLKDPHFMQFDSKPYCEKCILLVNPKGASVKATVKDMGFKFT